MKNLFVRLVREESGQDLIEYALLAGIIAIGAVTVMGQVKGGINTVLGKVVTELGKI